MQIVRHTDASEFLRENGPALERFEAENSLLLGLALGLDHAAYYTDAPPVLVSVGHPGSWLLAGLMTPPHPLVLASMTEDPATSVSALVEHFIQSNQAVSGITANRGLAQMFAAEWESRTHRTRSAEMRQRIYRLRRVIHLEAPSGSLRHPHGTDEGLVADWVAAFQLEADHNPDAERAKEMAKRRLERGEIYLWEHSVPRCMVGRSRPTRNTISVNAVYTPPEFRRRGYATAAVAQLSQLLLDEGYAECVLYTDLANPTSNAIYQRIGYETVCDSARILFAARSA